MKKYGGLLKRNFIVLTVVLFSVYTWSHVHSLTASSSFLPQRHSKGGRSLLNIDENQTISDGESPFNNSVNCFKPAIEQFPSPIIGKSARQHGLVIIHIFIGFYMFIGLAIVCDEYFVPSLELLSNVLNLPPDVAGATFMAAGSSAPELATAVIGVFVSEDDIGISGVIGSAIFNITLVISVCALAASEVLYLNWYSVLRDCGCYLFSVIILLATIGDEQVTWFESLLFLVFYTLYCVGMCYNSLLEDWVKRKFKVPENWTKASEHNSREKNLSSENEETSIGNKDTSETRSREIPLTPLTENIPDEMNPLQAPDKKNKLLWMKWCILYPLYAISIYTIPDCRQRKWSSWYIATFLLSIFWISVYSYFMVWMITVVGFTFEIPDTVMGLTLIAAGVSLPDALSGIAVVKDGHGDMAVSNAIGSNVFDILLCLGLPWFIKTAIVSPGSVVKVRSKGLLYSTMSLLSTVVFLIFACHSNGWKLDRRFGITLFIWYFIFIIFASLYELNVFGDFNPVECFSSY